MYSELSYSSFNTNYCINNYSIRTMKVISLWHLSFNFLIFLLSASCRICQVEVR